MGADGVQMGTRFLATEESSATAAYKQAVVDATGRHPRRDDPGSPCGLPFRVIKQSPMYVSALARRRKPKCDKGYVLLKDEKGNFTRCLAKESNFHHFCICNGLLSSAGYNPDEEEPIYTVGVDRRPGRPHPERRRADGRARRGVGGGGRGGGGATTTPPPFSHRRQSDIQRGGTAGHEESHGRACS